MSEIQSGDGAEWSSDGPHPSRGRSRRHSNSFACSVRYHSDFNVCGEAGDGREAVDLVYQKKPGIVVIDINLPIVDGIEATRQIRQVSVGSANGSFATGRPLKEVCCCAESGRPDWGLELTLNSLRGANPNGCAIGRGRMAERDPETGALTIKTAAGISMCERGAASAAPACGVSRSGHRRAERSARDRRRHPPPHLRRQAARVLRSAQPLA